MIHCFGDSHISIISGENRLVPVGNVKSQEIFSINHVGPYLAYTLPTKKWGGVAYDNSDSLLFSFGEIDCRCHVHKRVNEERTYQEVVGEIVERYMSVLTGYTCKNIYILDITPCLVEYPYKLYFDSAPANADIEYHHTGTLDERNVYKRYMSNLLREECDKRGYKFINTFDHVLGKTELYIDDVHLKGESVIEHIKSQIEL